MRNPTLLLALCLPLFSCTGDAPPDALPDGENPDVVLDAGPTADEAKAFAAKVDTELREVWVKNDLAAWDHYTDLNDENEKKATAARPR